MDSSNESVYFVGENHPDEDPSEVTSKRTGFQSASSSSGWRRSWQQAAALFVVCWMRRMRWEVTRRRSLP
ncbi:UNVERIFIED_CONTAM: hypothetical protein Slati_2425000 [Sesamum latifolium]|uniref:Uncharacterized protein n=1 Tax=Sesamum latifolium TaxID=2727402 RepID=A0AAW2WCH4_9LAMI